MGNQNEEILELVDNCVSMVNNIDNLDNNVILELYGIQKQLIDIINRDVQNYRVGLRSLLCRNQDVVLNKIAEFYDVQNIGLSKNVYTPAVQGLRNWNNVELLKDKGLVGYFLSKVTGAKPVMMFCSTDIDYTFNENLENQELIFSDKNLSMEQQYLDYLINNYQKMDILVLHGMYDETINFLNIYRQLRPDGKVYCGLDMNKGWLERIDWNDEGIKRFASQCDVIGTSSAKLCDILNNKKEVSFPCYYIPNGFSNMDETDVVADAKVKENIFLTVGRIGTEQKNNLEMLLAFANVADRMLTWNLKLVGPIEEEFKIVIKKFFEAFPHLKKRVIFTGPITDKKLLYAEYAKAKCFILTSIYEGAPNVYAEALNHGCKFIFSKFDCAEEMINYGELGDVYDIGNQDALVECMLKLKHTTTQTHFEAHIEKTKVYAKEHYDWEKIAKKIAFMLTYTNK